MLKTISYALASSLVFAGSTFAGELGVTNSYGNSFRSGTGTTNIQWTTNAQLTEQSAFGAIKLETSSYNGGSGFNNGWGNGDHDAPGHSGPHNHAENGGDKDKGKGKDKDNGGLPNPGSSYGDRAFAASLAFGTRNYTENTSVTGTTEETYSFGSSNFTHSVGVFSR